MILPGKAVLFWPRAFPSKLSCAQPRRARTEGHCPARSSKPSFRLPNRHSARSRGISMGLHCGQPDSATALRLRRMTMAGIGAIAGSQLLRAWPPIQRICYVFRRRPGHPEIQTLDRHRLSADYLLPWCRRHKVNGARYCRPLPGRHRLPRSRFAPAVVSLHRRKP